MGTYLTHATVAGIATIIWNGPGSTPNVFNETSIAEFGEVIRGLIADPAVAGIVITSAKTDFIVGADLTTLLEAARSSRGAFFGRVRAFQQLFRDIETGGKPVVAALNGTAVGGGFELALACHARVAADLPSLRVGLPEVSLGLLPGAGGTQRLPRLVGLREAIGLITQSRTLSAAKALDLGLLSEIVPADVLLTRAAELARTADPVQPWDRKGFRVPGGDVHSPAGLETFVGANASITRETWGNYPAPRLAVQAIYHGLQMPIDQGLKVEARGFVELVFDPQTRGMVRTFFSMGNARRLKTRPADVPKATLRRIGVIGAGLMGHGIAHAAAARGVEVVLLDRDESAARHGKERVAAILEAAVAKGRLTRAAADAATDRVRPSALFDDLAGVDLVVEAVFEQRELKAEVTRRAEAAMPAGAMFASNTSTLPITGLAAASVRPEQFIGLHFFSPVEKMPLVEVILGKQTSDETLARALDFVAAIGKTPVVVQDGRGFFTSRVFGTYITEGVSMLAEGVGPMLLEHGGRLAGMPMGPLTVADMVNLDLSRKIREQTRADLGTDYVSPPSDRVIDVMVDAGRLGQKVGAGFFDYPASGQKRLWPELTGLFPAATSQPTLAEVKRRLLHIQAIETLRCMEEGVVRRPEDADVASILGWGFCPFLGGIASYIDFVGTARLARECDELADRHGARFRPPALLRTLARDGTALYSP